MRIVASFLFLMLMQIHSGPPAMGQTGEDRGPEQRAVLAAMTRLSDATAPGGGGADAYAAVLHEAYSRWTVGSDAINDKPRWVEGVRGWFDDGWRVADREVQHLEITVRGDYAFTRRVVEETYLGPEGERSVSGAALAEVWFHGESGWLLLRVDAHPLETE